MDRLAAACSRYGLTISLKKTVVLYQPAPGKLYVPPVISIGDHEESQTGSLKQA